MENVVFAYKYLFLAEDITDALYLISMQSSNSLLPVNDVFYSIKWVHDISNDKNPCTSKMTIAVKKEQDSSYWIKFIFQIPLNILVIQTTLTCCAGDNAPTDGEHLLTIIVTLQCGTPTAYTTRMATTFIMPRSLLAHCTLGCGAPYWKRNELSYLAHQCSEFC